MYVRLYTEEMSGQKNLLPNVLFISLKVTFLLYHYSNVIMGAMTSQITSLTIVDSTVYSGRSKKTSKLRVTGLCAGNSPVTGEFPAQRPVTRKMLTFDDVIMSPSKREAGYLTSWKIGFKPKVPTAVPTGITVVTFIITNDQRNTKIRWK